METRQQRILRNTIGLFIVMLAILIMVTLSNEYDRAHRPLGVTKVVHDTIYLPKPLTIVVGAKGYHVVGDTPKIVQALNPILDNGDIAKANKRRYYDKSTTD